MPAFFTVSHEYKSLQLYKTTVTGVKVVPVYRKRLF